MIPKIIHYCWFGGNPKSNVAKKCIDSWKKYCPDYKIIEWNESNYDISSAPLYVTQAYEKKKWAFVSDFVRLKVIYDNGGVYLDTDVELVSSLDSLLKYKAYFGFEGVDYINTGLGFASEKGNYILLELMSDYEKIQFIMPDGNLDVTPCPIINTKIFVKHGLVKDGRKQILDDGTLILSAEYLCPIDNATRILNKTRNTISIHHFDASWQSEDERKAHNKLARKRRLKLKKERVLYYPRWLIRKIIGDEIYEKIKKAIKG